MKTVAVSQRVDDHLERGEYRDALDQRLVTFLLSAGYLPVPIPNDLSSNVSKHRSQYFVEWMHNVAPSAILLSGGNEIGKYPSRDCTEFMLLKFAEKLGLPLLGICRGMQMMGVRAGGTLERKEGHVRIYHHVRGPISRLVNSYHEFSIATCPPGFSVLAYAEDGAIEAIRHDTLPWEGWMWHPEREAIFDRQDILRLSGLFR